MNVNMKPNCQKCSAPDYEITSQWIVFSGYLFMERWGGRLHSCCNFPLHIITHKMIVAYQIHVFGGGSLRVLKRHFVPQPNVK